MRRASPTALHNGLLELPITTTRVMSRNLPAGGGGFFRLLPYRASSWAIERVNRIDRQPAIFYFHPWEIDPHQPRIRGRERQDPLPPLPEPRPHRVAPEPAAVRLPLGPHRPRVRDRAPREAARSSSRRAVGADGAPVSRGRPRGVVARSSRDCPEATFFHRIEWRDLIEDVFRHRTHYLVAERGGAVVGVLPLARVKSLLFGDCAGVAAVRGLRRRGGRRRVGAGRRCTASASDLARDLGVQHLELRNRVATEPEWPRQDLYVTFRKTLLPEVEANLLAIPRKQRAMVRKGIERGLVSEIDERRRPFLRAVCRQPAPARHAAVLAALLRGAAQRVRRRLRGADRRSTRRARRCRRCCRSTSATRCCRTTPATTSGARALAANDFKYWELMRRAVERGLRVFDYGRSKRGTGSFDFKKNWGFEPQPLHYEYLPAEARRASRRTTRRTRSTARSSRCGAGCRGRWPMRSVPRSCATWADATMEPLLYLVHRIPFPPNKGDKIRSYHLLRHLAERYAVHLGTLRRHAGGPRACPAAGVAVRLASCRDAGSARRARCAASSGFLTGEALTLPYYRNADAAGMGQARLSSSTEYERQSSSRPPMAQYVRDLPGLHVVLDFVDVDSAKWTRVRRAPRVAVVVRLSARGRASCWPSSVQAAAAQRGQRLCHARRGGSLPASGAGCSSARARDRERRQHRLLLRRVPNASRRTPPTRRRSCSPVRWTTGPTSMPSPGSLRRCCRASSPRVPDARFYIVGMNPGADRHGAGLASRASS